MATQTHAGQSQTATTDLEGEVEHLRAELARSRKRSGAVQLAAFFAVLLGLAALIGVAFRVNHDQTTLNAMHDQMSGTQMPANMPANMGGRGSATATSSESAGPAQPVSAQLGDYWVRPDVTSVPAGKVTFTAENVGAVPHELMIERAPIKMQGPGQPVEDAALGMIDDMAPGESGQMTVTLKPGMYVLFCNAPGHYAAGQHTMFRVTG
jgi:uncharacterized cupredoxin-like copper-binding protein